MLFNKEVTEMAFLIDLKLSNGSVRTDVYARLDRSQRALSVAVDMFAKGETIAPAGIRSPSFQLASKGTVCIARHGAAPSR